MHLNETRAIGILSLQTMIAVARGGTQTNWKISPLSSFVSQSRIELGPQKCLHSSYCSPLSASISPSVFLFSPAIAFAGGKLTDLFVCAHAAIYLTSVVLSLCSRWRGRKTAEGKRWSNLFFSPTWEGNTLVPLPPRMDGSLHYRDGKRVGRTRERRMEENGWLLRWFPLMLQRTISCPLA